MIPGFVPRYTYAIIVLCVLVSLYTRFGNDFDSLRPLLITNYVDAGLLEIRHGQVWRLITPIFIHFGVLHIALNMLWLWKLGEAIEATRGPVVLIGLILTSAILSNLAEFYASGPLFGGMSGVIFALLGYLWIQGRFNPMFAIRLNPGLVTMVMVWFAICWSGILETFGIHIANFAHTAGLICGAVVGFIAATTRSVRL
jgi:GlpG protein